LWFVCIVWYRSCKALWRLPVGISVVPDCPIAAAGPPAHHQHLRIFFKTQH
jgi:hypothetical protein